MNNSIFGSTFNPFLGRTNTYPATAQEKQSDSNPEGATGLENSDGANASDAAGSTGDGSTGDGSTGSSEGTGEPNTEPTGDTTNPENSASVEGKAHVSDAAPAQPVLTGRAARRAAAARS